MTHEDKKIGGTGQNYASDDEKLSAMISGLKRVEAPKDFEFHLKGRIAKGRPEEVRKSGLFPALKYAMPLALFLVVGASIFMVSSYNDPLTPELSVAPPSDDPGRVPKVELPVTPFPEIAGGSNDQSAPAPAAKPAFERSVRNEQPAIAANRSRTAGSRDSHTPRSQPDLPLRTADSALRGTDRAITPVKMLKAKEALELIGIDADYEQGAWTVRSVKANEVGGLIGIRPGDKIKTIDGKAIEKDTEFDGVIKVTKVQVLRGEAAVELGAKDRPD